MKTAREFLEKEFHAFGDDELQLYITLNPDVRRIISAMENYAKQHSVMQAEGSDGAVGRQLPKRVGCKPCAYGLREALRGSGLQFVGIGNCA